MSMGNMCQLETIKLKLKDKNIWRIFFNLLLQILAVISRYGPRLMIVMIYVTQTNF